MSAPRWWTGALLLALGVLAGVGLVWTRERTPPPVAERAPGQGPAAPGARRERLVDTSPLLTARRLSALATSLEEQELVREAERLADHAVDLAFVEALRDATEVAPDLTPEAKVLVGARAKAQAAVDAGQDRVRRITAQLGAAPERDRARLQDQLDVATAQLELDRDELEVATESLRRAGGDPQARVRRLKEVYEAARNEPRASAAQATAPGSAAASLLGRFRAWMWQRDKVHRLAKARQDALDRVERMTRWRATLAERIRQEAEARETAKRSAAGISEGQAATPSREAAQASLVSLRRFSDPQRKVASLGRRIQDQQDLGEAYASWVSVARGQERTALHRVIEGALWIVLVLLATFLGRRLVDRLFRGAAGEKLRIETLRTVANFAVQVIGVVLVLFILFGLPDQSTTILGLAGAGLTVALKDFIVAFFGWFVLMGRNGIRVGDWVEIKGVGGEVVEIGLLHTVLLETGSWTDAGHPTGRRVSFVNSFAIEGHYFNFSTSGQWMWDELRVLVPPGQDPYPIIDGVQRRVEQETEANAKLAEGEWARTTTRYKVRTFSAVPGINVVPTAAGIELDVRYITRAHERHATRRKLYASIVELMHGKRGAAPDATAA